MKQSRSDQVFVTFWGTRGSIATPGSATQKYGGNTACVAVEYRRTCIILDAGTGIRNLGLHLNATTRHGTTGSLSLHLLLSHTHWDHIQGLPFFGPAYVPKSRIQIYGTPRGGSDLRRVLEGQMDVTYFPVDMRSLSAQVSVTELVTPELKIGPVTVQWQEQVFHPGGCVRYKLSMGGRHIVFATDTEVDRMLADPQDAANRRRYKEYCDFSSGADILIADAQYTAEEYQSRKGWGHSSVEAAVQMARNARVRQLALFHHDPLHSDAFLDEVAAKQTALCIQKKYPMNVFCAREGMTLAI